MKKIILLFCLIFLVGCNQKVQEKTEIKNEIEKENVEIINTETKKNVSPDLSEKQKCKGFYNYYNKKCYNNDDKNVEEKNYIFKINAKEKKNMTDYSVFHGDEIGTGMIFNDSENKDIDKWYFVFKEKENVKKFDLIIKNDCLIDSIGFKEGSCKKFLELEKQQNHSFVKISAITIFGEIKKDEIIEVSNIILVQ